MYLETIEECFVGLHLARLCALDQALHNGRHSLFGHDRHAQLRWRHAPLGEHFARPLHAHFLGQPQRLLAAHALGALDAHERVQRRVQVTVGALAQHSAALATTTIAVFVIVVHNGRGSRLECLL